MKRDLVAAIILLILFIAVSFWRLDSWARWKFSYRPVIERRIGELENRMKAVEDKLKDK